MPDRIAVLTGDIVRSALLAPAELDRAMAALADGAATAAGWGDGAARFTRFRGDGWQCLAPSPPLAFRVALLLRARLRTEGRAFDTRIAVGIGAAEMPAAGDLAAASGPAFRLAGHGLDTMHRSARLAVGWQDPPADADKVAAIVALLDTLSRRWTPAQARVLVATLPPAAPTQAEVAAGLGISQQMVAKHLRAAGDPAVETALAALEKPA
jgi:alkanesulfonate monooxygenase SsuD/methylene tetrahydromethanopterin reductase-like flavin-dependent oxidoreductase (luciferase family)